MYRYKCTAAQCDSHIRPRSFRRAANSRTAPPSMHRGILARSQRRRRHCKMVRRRTRTRTAKTRTALSRSCSPTPSCMRRGTGNARAFATPYVDRGWEVLFSWRDRLATENVRGARVIHSIDNNGRCCELSYPRICFVGLLSKFQIISEYHTCTIPAIIMRCVGDAFKMKVDPIVQGCAFSTPKSWLDKYLPPDSFKCNLCSRWPETHGSTIPQNSTYTVRLHSLAYTQVKVHRDSSQARRMSVRTARG